MIQRTSLSIKLFAECNMSCSYCIQRTQVQHDCTDLRGTLSSHLSKYSYESISIMGGEPLLIPNYVVQLIEIIKEMAPETTVSVMTNGTHLTGPLVDFFNKNEIGVTLSTNSLSGGEKSLVEISEKALLGHGVIAMIREVSSLSIRKVVTLSEAAFAHEVSFLREFLAPQRIQISPDYTTLPDFGAKALMNFETSVSSLYHWYGGDLNWLFISGLNKAECDCSRNVILNSDGSMTTLADVQGNRNIVEGCSLFENSMGKENYALYRKILGRYFPG